MAGPTPSNGAASGTGFPVRYIQRWHRSPEKGLGDDAAKSPMTAIPAVLDSYIEGLKAHDVNRIAATVSDDLAFVTPARTLNKEQFLAMLRPSTPASRTGITTTTSPSGAGT